MAGSKAPDPGWPELNRPVNTWLNGAELPATMPAASAAPADPGSGAGGFPSLVSGFDIFNFSWVSLWLAGGEVGAAPVDRGGRRLSRERLPPPAAGLLRSMRGRLSSAYAAVWSGGWEASELTAYLNSPEYLEPAPSAGSLGCAAPRKCPSSQAPTPPAARAADGSQARLLGVSATLFAECLVGKRDVDFAKFAAACSNFNEVVRHIGPSAGPLMHEMDVNVIKVVKAGRREPACAGSSSARALLEAEVASGMHGAGAQLADKAGRRRL